jgi:hypothetical protein
MQLRKLIFMERGTNPPVPVVYSAGASVSILRTAGDGKTYTFVEL